MENEKWGLDHDREASCKDVSRHGKGELALQEVLLQLQDELLILGIAVVPILHVGVRKVGGRGWSWSSQRWC